VGQQILEAIMIRRQQGALQWLEFELLSEIPNLAHGVLLRHGGCSQGPFASLNLSKSVGDLPAHVDANRQFLLSTLSLPPLFSCRLVHGAEVTAVSSFSPPPTCDAITTVDPTITLLNTHADCQVAIFYDPIHHALANVHCGWKGSVKNIYAATIQHMRFTYGSLPTDLLVCISPSLGPQSAEFIHYKTELPETFWPFQIKPTYFDFWAISEWQLTQAGILLHHLQIAGLDIFTNPTDYFSYRRDKITGRHATFAWLRRGAAPPQTPPRQRAMPFGNPNVIEGSSAASRALDYRTVVSEKCRNKRILP
jgi:YfiH family protein